MTYPPPSTCFWELNRRCQLLCRHCRAESGPSGDPGLPLERNLHIADQLIALGLRLVILTGGEPTLSPGWDQIARRLAYGGVKVRLFGSGSALTREVIDRALSSGVVEFALSLDGPEEIHDALRPAADSSQPSDFAAACDALGQLKAADSPTWVVTQVGRLNLEGLDETYQLLCQLGADRWLVHLCQAAGRARHHRRQLICTPSSLEFIVSLLLRVAREGRIIAPLTCSIGYLSAEEPLLRGRGGNRRPIWRGCGAGVQTLAITSRGGIKGCTTLPDEFVSSSLDQRTLAEIWADDEVFPYTRAWSRELLTGPCARCGLGERCRGGCPSVAYGATGSIGSNPYCLRLVRGQ